MPMTSDHEAAGGLIRTAFSGLKAGPATAYVKKLGASNAAVVFQKHAV
jgi:hypothetical protein